MIENNQLRPAVRALYEVAVKMETEGKEVTFSSLSNECGSHSKRDVSAALDLYRDEKEELKIQLILCQKISTAKFRD